MTDFRHDRSDEFKKPYPERGNPHGGHGRRAEHEMAEQFETQTGRPLGEAGDGTTPGEQRPADIAENGGLERGQHARKGQAESPRELGSNQPEKHREGHR
jgi:hypothetical protein